MRKSNDKRMYEPHVKVLQYIIERDRDIYCDFVLPKCTAYRLENLERVDFSITGIRVIDEVYNWEDYVGSDGKVHISSPLYVETIGEYNNYLRKINKIDMVNYEKGDLKPVIFEGANKILQGTDKDTEPLHVYNNQDTSVSCWKLSLRDILRMLFRPKQRFIWMGIKSGPSQPPVWLTTRYPFK